MSFTATIRRPGVAAVLAAFALAGGVAHAQEAATAAEEEKPVSVRLIADRESVEPGTTMTLGALFEMKPDWHVYWRNPGETGFQTKVSWTGPGGAPLANVETLYPAPIPFVSPGDLVSFGYEGQVLLMTEIQVPADATGELDLGGKASWLMCSDRCIPGRETLSLKLPVGPDKPANQELFEKYRSRLPKKYAPGSYPEGVSGAIKPVEGGVEATVTAETAPGKIVGEDRGNGQLRRLYLFPFVASKESGTVVGTPRIPEPEGTASLPSGAVKVYESPVAMTVKAEAGSTSKPAPQAVNAVLVIQRLQPDGTAQPPEFAEIEVK